MSHNIIGLALGGGSARGFAHIGVIEALMEAGLYPEIVAGTSVGAIAGAFYAMNEIDLLRRFVHGLTVRSVLRYLDVSFSGSSIMAGRRLERTLNSHFGNIQIEQLDRRFVAIATELGTGQEIWLTSGSLVAALRASYALPGLFKPVKLDGRWLMDGALVNPIPVSAARALGADFVIAVTFHAGHYIRNTLFPVEATAHPENLEHIGEDQSHLKEGRLAAFKRQMLNWRASGNNNNNNNSTPGVTRVMLEAFNITQSRIARSRLAGDPPDATIQVHLDNIGLFDFHKAEHAIAAGRLAVQRYLSSMPRGDTVDI